ncbi:MucBP domain-containing protein [Paenibacillus dokdonensis]|uniref:MucBP domain-containing protein n=1 Tax=Paenibacillus dokdonensis TaxID=2567944 RepID=A0ABU6GP75_9BACL|nr:MucBP domain-containing protein [Paenibacillus dokdonensis]MEC0241228.1 MucBP domain-containing protein [Paenibacillus dokdonensis]
MKRGYKLILSWLCIVALFTGLIPGGFFVNSASAAASGEIVFPNPGATNLKKIAEPVEGKKGQWKVTLTVEGKNIKTASDVVLVIDKSGSMKDSKTSKRMTNAKEAAKNFVDNLLVKDSMNRIAVVSFNKTSTNVSGLVDAGQKGTLKTKIDEISPDGGTNIQAGLNMARTMLEGSSAQNKVIVLLSDGAPTYSYKAADAVAYTWPSNKYKFALSKFDYKKVLGSGADFDLAYGGFWDYTDETYTVNKFKVPDNGIGTLSEAKLARDSGISVYSIGLEVGNDDNAKYVLNNVQNKGYYSSSSDELSKVFSELSGKISYAAQDALVTDPMGSMFKLVGDPTVSQGTYKLESTGRTIKWTVGNIIEGSAATMSYIVEMDQSKKPDPNIKYPTNGDTTLEYNDIYGKSTKKNFEVPEVSFGKGSIQVKGYRVNTEGKPVNEEGVVVDKPEQAQEVVKSYYFQQNGNESLDINKTYDVNAPVVNGYELKVGTDPTKVALTIGIPTPTVWFGFMVAVEQQVNIKYLEKGTNKELAPATLEKGMKGKQVLLTAKTIQGYTAEKASDKYTFTTDKDQNYTFYYTANEQTVTVKYLEKGTNKEVSPATSAKGGTGKEVDLKAANVAGYTPEKLEAKYTFTAESGQVYTFYYTANDYKVTVKYQDESGKDVAPAQDLKGKAGDKLDVTAVEVEGYTPVKSSDVYTITNKDNQQYVFTYKVKTYPVTVKFQDESGKELATPVKLEGAAGTKLNVTAANVEGYTPNQSSDVYTVTKADNQEYVFKYTANIYTVTVKFEDEGGTELAKPLALKGKAGEKLDVTAAKVDGYTPSKLSDIYTVTQAGNQEYVFKYTANIYTVTVKFEDESGTELTKPIALKGKAGEKLDVTAAEVEDYTPIKSSDQYTVTTKEDQQYVFTYKVKTYTVLVKFIDESGKELATAIPLEGAAGDKLDVTAANVDGYTPNKETDVYTVTKASSQTYVFTYTLTTYPVTVKYQDEHGAQLEKPLKLEGTEGQTLELTAADIKGYTPKNATHQYTVIKALDQDYVFTYALKTFEVQVNFVDEEGAALIPASKAEGKPGEKLTLTAEKIEGYTPDQSSFEYEVTKEDNQSYTFHYKANDQTATVKYLAQGGGKVLADETTISGKPGKTVDVEIPTVAGYTPVNEKESYTFTKGSGQEHVVYYTANAQTVTVNYVEEGTNDQVAPSTTQSGVTDTTITLKAAEAPGYTPVKAEDNYTFSAEKIQSYTFTYKKQDYAVKVRFVDEEGNDLVPAHNLSGKVGEELTVTAEKVTGYRPVKESDQYIVTKNDEQEYVFHYNKVYAVLVKFVDEENKELATAINLEGMADQELTVTAAEVGGYTPHKQIDVYVVTKQAIQSYTFYYTANEQPQEKRTITIKYLISGTETQLQDPTTQDGNVGVEITLEAPHFDGYTTEEYYVQYPVSEQQGQEYIFYYTKDETPENEQRTVTIHYVDQETGETVAESTAQEGNVGETLFLTADKITYNESVYTPVIFNDDYLITENQEQEYTFYYEKSDVEGIQQVLVKFLDKESGEQIGEQIRQGRPEQKITITPGNIKVGEIVYKPELPSSTYTFTAEENQEIEIYFIKDGVPVVKDQTITVKYLDQKTNTEVATPTIKTGKVGSNISLTAASVSGYTPVKSTFVYTFGDEDGQEYIFYYTKNSPPVTPTDPNPSTPDPTPSTPSTPSGSSSVTPLPPAPPVVAPLPPAPPKLETDNHYNYINGYPDGTIKPENNISREEVAAIFYRLMDDATRSDYIKNISSYKDVEKTRWSNKNIATMENAGIITGYPDGTFKPGRQITRAEFAAIASRFDDLDQQVNTSFSDIKGHWAEKYIVSAANKGWIKGYPDGKFKPDQYITRAEAMAFINSVLNRKVTVEGIHENAKTWPDNTQNKWYYTDVLEATNNHEYSRNTDETETWEQVKPDRVYP